MQPELDKPIGEAKIVTAAVHEESIFNKELKQTIEAIPNRLAFKIGEVAQIAGVKTYVLRYWESEFDGLKPKKSSNNQRVYERRDIENVLIIKKLLHKDKYSIEGAKAALKRHRKLGKKARELYESSNQYGLIIEKIESLLVKMDGCLTCLES